MFEFNTLKVCYGQSEVIPNLSMKLGEGEILGVMGRNGRVRPQLDVAKCNDRKMLSI